MRRAACFTIIGAVLVAGISTGVWAAQGYTGAGPYVGIGPAGGFSTFQDDLENFGNSLGFNARGGYRFNDYFAAEALYEYMDDFGTTLIARNRVAGHVDILFRLARIADTSLYGLSPISDYEAALGDEAERLADQSFTQILTAPAPAPFTELFANDRARMRSIAAA